VAPQLALSWQMADNLLGGPAREMSALALQNEVTLDVKPTEPGLQLHVDPLRFRQVMNNLLSNAVKFTGKGGMVTVTAGLGPNGMAEVVVRDTGMGMRPEDIPRALEPFQQLDGGLARSFPGTGLGLPIAKGLVEAHGGTLRIESAAGEGTAVTIELPASAARLIRTTERTGAAAQ
jgi:signal transduction histidine kinase